MLRVDSLLHHKWLLTSFMNLIFKYIIKKLDNSKVKFIELWVNLSDCIYNNIYSK